MNEYIIFNSRDEILRINVSCIVYFEAFGNYTKIILENGFQGLVCVNLGRMEYLLSEQLKEKAKTFARVGKRHIINLSFLMKITPLKQNLILSDQRNFQYSLEVSKEALKKLKDLIAGSVVSKS